MFALSLISGIGEKREFMLIFAYSMKVNET